MVEEGKEEVKEEAGKEEEEKEEMKEEDGKEKEEQEFFFHTFN